MVRNYQRKTSRGQYGSEALQKAIDATVNNGMSLKKASVVFGVPRTTLKRCLKIDKLPSSLGRFSPVFSDEFENELVMHVVEMQQRFYGLTLCDLRSVAYQLAERNELKHPFSSNTKLAGTDWAHSFLKRYPELSLRKPEATSMSRLSGFNKVQVQKFFDLLSSKLKTKKFSPKQIFNVDETGITTVQTPGKILARKGSKQVGRVVSAERGSTTTVLCAMSADGCYVPPVFLFKRKNMNDRLLKNCPPGSVGFPSPTGWIDCNLFLRYLQHFIACVKPSESHPILLILDGHCSHKSLEAIEMARQHHITMLTIPPHTSHRLQPLDLTFFGPLKAMYNRQVDKWMLSNPGKRVTDYELCEIFSPAYQQVASIDKAVKGFQCSGIMPYNPDVFSDEDFAPATVTELPSASVDVTKTSHSAKQDYGVQKQLSAKMKSQSKQAAAAKRRNMFDDDVEPCTSTNSGGVHVLDISPYPRISSDGNSTRKRRAEVSTILTSTPNKIMMQEKMNRKKKNAKPVAQKRLRLTPKRNSKAKKSKMDKNEGNKCLQVIADTAEPTNSSNLKPVNKKKSHRCTQSTAVRRPNLSSKRQLLPRKPNWLIAKQSGLLLYGFLIAFSLQQVEILLLFL